VYDLTNDPASDAQGLGRVILAQVNELNRDVILVESSGGIDSAPSAALAAATVRANRVLRVLDAQRNVHPALQPTCWRSPYQSYKASFYERESDGE
jgi:NH3-dependent NAD+ synthetase